MSTCRHHLHASQDPTKTKSIRRTYAQRLRGGYERINSALRERIIKDDILGYHDTGELFAVDGPPDLSTLDEDEVIDELEDWIDTAQESEVMEVIERDNNTYVRRAYERGLDDADTNLRRAGLDPDNVPVEVLLSMPVHERKLQVIFSRNYAELDGITDAVAQQATRELSDGLGQGLNPTEIARGMTDRINKIGKTRATVLARTEVINAHSQATIERYREQGVEQVGIEPEVSIQTATDDRVCEECAEAAQRGPWDLDEFEGSEYQPPIHPQCRCSVIPIVD